VADHAAPDAGRVGVVVHVKDRPEGRPLHTREGPT
jgi:hypothetical protein